MGKVNHVMHRYLEDNTRFADLFNGAYFNGKSVVQAKDLVEGSELYAEGEERSRDLKKHLRTGGTLRVLAVENQNLVDYAMPFRCMEYDTMEYQKQMNRLRKENRKAMQEKTENFTPAERLCSMKKTDKLSPVHTICLYHGEEPWDGPRSLKDMMDFGVDTDDISALFADYPMNLYCINEEQDFSVFHTELRELFSAMRYRKDREGLEKLMRENESYRHLEEDTVEVLAVMLNAPKIWEKRELYMDKNEEKEEYDMCQALREWIEEERSAGMAEGMVTGRKEGLDEKTRQIVENMIKRGMQDVDIRAIAECGQDVIDEVRRKVNA